MESAVLRRDRLLHGWTGGFRVQGSGFGVRGSGFTVQGFMESAVPRREIPKSSSSSSFVLVLESVEDECQVLISI